MNTRKQSSGAHPISDLAVDILDPVLRRRAGLTIGLVQSWEEIAGARLAASTRPERIAWPRRLHEDDPFEPATLVVACEGAAALRLQHETGEIIERANAFLGFAAIGRIRIVQKKVAPERKQRPQERPLTGDEAAKLDRLVDGIEDEGLRASLSRLGRSVIGSKG